MAKKAEEEKKAKEKAQAEIAKQIALEKKKRDERLAALKKE